VRCHRPGIVVALGSAPLACRGTGPEEWEAPAPFAPRAINERIKSVVVDAHVVCWPDLWPFSSKRALALLLWQRFGPESRAAKNRVPVHLEANAAESHHSDVTQKDLLHMNNDHAEAGAPPYARH